MPTTETNNTDRARAQILWKIWKATGATPRRDLVPDSRQLLPSVVMSGPSDCR